MPDVKNLFWLVGLALLTPACALAQVQVNPAALQQLQGLMPALPTVQPVAPPPARHFVPQHKHSPKKKAAPKAGSEAEQPAKPKAPTPQHPALTPASKKPAVPTTPVAAPSVAHIDFAPGSAILPADVEATLKPFCATSARIPLVARAPATPDDPSDAMQLSMQRAFAIRAALISCGVPAQNIIPQSTVGAFGPNSDEALIGARTKP